VRRFIKYFLAAGDLFFSGDGFPQAARRWLARNAGRSRRAVTQAARHVCPGAALMIAKADGIGNRLVQSGQGQRISSISPAPRKD